MTDEEKRQLKSRLMLQYEETRLELEHLRTKAWNLSQDIGEVAHWILQARELQATLRERERDQARDEQILKNASHYRNALDFDALLSLREELRSTNARLQELAQQKNNLGLGS